MPYAQAINIVSDLEVTTTVEGDTSIEKHRFPVGDASVADSRGKKLPMMTMRLISGEELKEKLDNEENIKLVFALGDWQYRAKHIPGSLHFHHLAEVLTVLDQSDEIVVYCSNPVCSASIFAYHFLVSRGYKNVRRYAGGLLDWEDAGYPLEGEGLN